MLPRADTRGSPSRKSPEEGFSDLTDPRTWGTENAPAWPFDPRPVILAALELGLANWLGADLIPPPGARGFKPAGRYGRLQMMAKGGPGLPRGIPGAKG